MVDAAFWFPTEHGAELETALYLAKGSFNFKKVFEVSLDLRGIGPGDGEVGLEEMLVVVGGLGEGRFGFGDAELTAFPVAVFARWTFSDDMALAVGSISMRRWARR